MRENDRLGGIWLNYLSCSAGRMHFARTNNWGSGPFGYWVWQIKLKTINCCIKQLKGVMKRGVISWPSTWDILWISSKFHFHWMLFSLMLIWCTSVWSSFQTLEQFVLISLKCGWDLTSGLWLTMDSHECCWKGGQGFIVLFCPFYWMSVSCRTKCTQIWIGIGHLQMGSFYQLCVGVT